MLTLQEIQYFIGKLNGWAVDGNSIVKIFSFEEFKQCLEFLNKVGEITEKFRHFPDVLINRNNVRLKLATSVQEGLTKKDFEVAEEIDKI